jgi:hypothetical protein
MAGGSFKAPIFTVAWPTGEFGRPERGEYARFEV